MRRYSNQPTRCVPHSAHARPAQYRASSVRHTWKFHACSTDGPALQPHGNGGWMGKRKVYLEDIPLDEAWRRFIAAMESAGRWGAFPGEEVPLDEALGRVTAQPVWAAFSSPGYHASAMDGYAVRAADTLGATETAPVRLQVGPEGKRNMWTRATLCRPGPMPSS